MKQNFKILRGPSEEEADEIFQNLSPYEMLWKAAKYGSLKWVKEALKKGAEINWEKDAALRLAAMYNNFEIVKFLLDNGANPLNWCKWPLRYANQNYLKINEFIQKCINERRFQNIKRTFRKRTRRSI